MNDGFIQSLEELEEDEVTEIVKERLEKGDDPTEIMDDIREGMSKVGDRFEEGRYFVPDLVYAGEILENLTTLIKEEMPQGMESKKIGTVVIGTVKGDLHDIGKNMVRFMLEANGFEVVDLGIDVPPEEFIEKVKEVEPDILALSAFLSSAFGAMEATIDLLEEEGLRDDLKIMIGGGQVDEMVAEDIEADVYKETPPEGVRQAKKWLGEM